MGQPAPRARRPLLPAGIRLAGLAFAVLCGVALVLLGEWHRDAVGPGRLDIWFWAAIGWSAPVHSRVLTFIADATGAAGIAAEAAMIAGLASWCRQWRLAVLSLAAPAGTAAGAELVKKAVHRSIWREGWLTYPSGHTAGVTSVLIVLMLAALPAAGDPVRASLVGLLAVTAVACGVGLTMVLLGAHYPTDAVGGYCLGITSTILTAAALDSLAGLAGRLLRQT